ncbi:MAG TPA: hypothetical protein DHU96_26815 [Actinobacteria bacterium]|nr:hypothetical protein [Actinomycetota bacterium]
MLADRREVRAVVTIRWLAFVRQTLKGTGLPARALLVNEAGASVYSASELAREEFP